MILFCGERLYLTSWNPFEVVSWFHFLYQQTRDEEREGRTRVTGEIRSGQISRAASTVVTATVTVWTAVGLQTRRVRQRRHGWNTPATDHQGTGHRSGTVSWHSVRKIWKGNKRVTSGWLSMLHSYGEREKLVWYWFSWTPQSQRSGSYLEMWLFVFN